MYFFIILVSIILIIISGKYLYNYLYQKNIEKKVNQFIENDKAKKPFFIADRNLFNLKNKWTLEYLKKKFEGQKINYTKMNKGILNQFEDIENINSNSDIFFNLISSKNGEKYYHAQCPMIDSLKKEIIIPQDYAKYGNISDIVFWIGGGNMFTPIHFDHDDGFLCVVKGTKNIKLINPKYSSLLKPFQTMMYSEYLNIEKTNNIPYLEYELREGDILFIPAGWWHCVKSSVGINIAYTIWLYPHDGKYNYDIVLKKLERLQNRKIPKFIHPKTLKFKEIKKLFETNLLNETQYRKNFLISNPMYTDIYD